MAFDRGSSASGQQPEPLVEMSSDVLRRHCPGSGGGQLDGKWDAVEAFTDLAMTISITSLEENAVFDLYSPSGSALAIETMEVEISPTEPGTYQLVAGGTRGNATYDLAVSIR